MSGAQPQSVLGISGAADDMVVQRRGDTGRVRLASTATSTRIVRALDPSGRSVADVEVPAGGTADLELPVGSYRVEVSGDDTAQLLADRVLVGDLWVLAGQSNMYGYASLDGAEQPHPLVHVFDMARRWRLATDPLHSLDSPDPVHTADVDDIEAVRTGLRHHGAGLGLAFAKEMVAATEVSVGLIPAAKGGATIADWSPELAGDGPHSLYGSMLRSVRAAGGAVRGVLWFQGESDSGTVELARAYPESLRALVAALRRDLGAATEFYVVQLSRNTLVPDNAARPWSLIRVAQTSEGIGADGVVASLDVELQDPLHIGTVGLQRIGRRLARLALGRADQIRVADVRGDPWSGPPPAMTRVRVELAGLRGGLRPRLHVPGFSVRTPDGERLRLLFRAEVRPDDTDAVHLWMFADAPVAPGAEVWYGYGNDPYCDLVDAEDNAVPSFGPIALDPPG